LAWQYAPGSWAVLELGTSMRFDHYWHQLAVKVASHARLGAQAAQVAPPVTFPVQLTGLPASWHLLSGVRALTPYWNGVLYQAYHGHLYARGWSVSTGPASTGPHATPYLTFTIRRAAQHIPCRAAELGNTVHQVVHGYHVTVSRGPGEQALCATEGGLSVEIDEGSNRPGPGLATVDLVSVFAHHVHLLGTNPADWARKPIR
jgi:hypothetical protein